MAPPGAPPTHTLPTDGRAKRAGTQAGMDLLTPFAAGDGGRAPPHIQFQGPPAPPAAQLHGHSSQLTIQVGALGCAARHLLLTTAVGQLFWKATGCGMWVGAAWGALAAYSKPSSARARACLKLKLENSNATVTHKQGPASRFVPAHLCLYGTHPCAPNPCGSECLCPLALNQGRRHQRARGKAPIRRTARGGQVGWWACCWL